jgi:lipoprotein-releasing system permease protein
VPLNYFERFIALRYIRPLRAGGLLSVISWFSFIGICIGVATLIIVMSVMNGFRYELENRIIGFNGHIFVQKYQNFFEDVSDKFVDIEEIKFVDANISQQVLISANNLTRGVVLKSFNTNNILEYKFKKNKSLIKDVKTGDIFLGLALAESIGARSGSKIKIFSTSTVSSPFGQLPKSKLMFVAGTFDTGMSEYDKNYAFIQLSDFQSLLGINDSISTVEIHLNTSNKTDLIKNEIINLLDNDDEFLIRDWKQVNSFFFETLSIERNVMFIILSLIIIVAAFNVITSLFILVKNKSDEIAILKTMGTSNNSILRIFLIVGSIIGVVGSLIGVSLGVLITLNLENLRVFLNSVFDINLFPSEFYFIDKIPTIVDINQILFIFVFSVMISLLATLYPSYVASKMRIREIFNNA